MAAQSTAQGYSTPTRPLLIHCLAFGPQGANGMPTLIQMQQDGNVFDDSGGSLPGYKIIDGSASTIVSNLQTAIKTILQNGVQVSLIQ